MNRALPLDEPHDLRHCVFRWYRDHYVNVVREQVPLLDAALLLCRQFLSEGEGLITGVNRGTAVIQILQSACDRVSYSSREPQGRGYATSSARRSLSRAALNRCDRAP